MNYLIHYKNSMQIQVENSRKYHKYKKERKKKIL